MRQGPAVQRVRITYGVGDSLIYASVLDMGRLWERLLRRARIPLVYSQGFNPHPRLQFAAPLPVGYSSDCELLDVWLSEAQPVAALQQELAAQSPQGLYIVCVADISLDSPSPQSEMQGARYRVRLCTAAGESAVREALGRLLSSDTLPRQRMKKGRMADYDLRPLVYELVLVGGEDGCFSIEMLLRASALGSGRPEEVVDALGIQVREAAIRRIALLWTGGSARQTTDEHEQGSRQ